MTTQRAADLTAVDAAALPSSGVLLASAARTAAPTDVQFGAPYEANGFEAIINVSAVGNGQSYVQGAAVTLPLVVVAGANDTFKYNAQEYTIAPGTYSTLAALATAVGAATKAGPIAFSTLVTVTASGTGLLFTSVPTGVNVKAFAVGTTDVLVSLGITDGWTIAHTAAAGADGVAALTFKVQGVTKLGVVYDILTSSAVTGTGTTRLRVSPNLAASANVVANDFVPDVLRVNVVAATDNSATYSIESLFTP